MWLVCSSVVDRGFKPRSCQSKDYKFGLRFFSAKHATLKKRGKDWLARNHGNVSEWIDMSTNPTKHVVLLQSGYHDHLTEN
jgi:hypothetical protein